MKKRLLASIKKVAFPFKRFKAESRKNYVNSQIDPRIYSKLIKLGVKLSVGEGNFNFA